MASSHQLKNPGVSVRLAAAGCIPSPPCCRRYCGLPCSVAVAWLLIAASCVELYAEDWGRFLGPRGDGTSAETGVNPKLWQPHPKIKWTLPLGTSYGAPAVVAGKVLQFDRIEELSVERLSCLDAENAQPLWHHDSPVTYADMYGYNNGPRCSPVVDDGLVFSYGVAGQLSCLELETGKLRWTKDTLRDYAVVQNFFGVASTPYVYKDKLLVMVGGSPPASQQLPASRLDLVQPAGSAIVAFDKRTGEERYRVGDELASYAALTVRQIGGQDVGLAFLRGGLLAWNPNTGEQLFHFPWRASKLESVNAALPITVDDQILLSEAYEIGSVLLQVEDLQPKIVWKDSGPWSGCRFRAHWSTPVLLDGYLYGCSGRNQPDSDFRCIRLSDGEVKWRDRRHERSSVLAVDGYLIVLGEYGRLELIRPSPAGLDVLAECQLNELTLPGDGQPLLDYPCWAAPILSDGLLYVRGDKRLVCFELIPR